MTVSANWPVKTGVVDIYQTGFSSVSLTIIENYSLSLQFILYRVKCCFDLPMVSGVLKHCYSVS